MGSGGKSVMGIGASIGGSDASYAPPAPTTWTPRPPVPTAASADSVTATARAATAGWRPDAGTADDGSRKADENQADEAYQRDEPGHSPHANKRSDQTGHLGLSSASIAARRIVSGAMNHFGGQPELTYQAASRPRMGAP